MTVGDLAVMKKDFFGSFRAMNKAKAFLETTNNALFDWQRGQVGGSSTVAVVAASSRRRSRGSMRIVAMETVAVAAHGGVADDNDSSMSSVSY